MYEIPVEFPEDLVLTDFPPLYGNLCDIPVVFQTDRQSFLSCCTACIKTGWHCLNTNCYHMPFNLLLSFNRSLCIFPSYNITFGAVTFRTFPLHLYSDYAFFDESFLFGMYYHLLKFYSRLIEQSVYNSYNEIKYWKKKKVQKDYQGNYPFESTYIFFLSI